MEYLEFSHESGLKIYFSVYFRKQGHIQTYYKIYKVFFITKSNFLVN